MDHNASATSKQTFFYKLGINDNRIEARQDNTLHIFLSPTMPLFLSFSLSHSCLIFYILLPLCSSLSLFLSRKSFSPSLSLPPSKERAHKINIILLYRKRKFVAQFQF